MLIRDIMTADVITIPPDTSVSDAKRIMEAHHIERLPVVDKGKLVGIVTTRRLESVSPSKATSLSVWELTYLLNNTKVKEVMEKKVVTVTPDTTAEQAVALAQSHKIGALVVLEAGKVVGIVTTNDFFYKIVNPILGLGSPGTRLEVANAGRAKDLKKILDEVTKLGLDVLTLHIEILPETKKRNVCLHVDTEDASDLVSNLQSQGFEVAVRKR